MKQTKITDFYKISKRILNRVIDKNKKVYGYNKETDSWNCIQCGVDMGSGNPRQLCGKWICYN